MAHARPGDRLLILTDSQADSDIAEACRDAGIEAGIDTRFLTIPYMEPTDTRELSPEAARIIMDANVILGICETMFDEKAAARQARENGARIAITSPAGMEDFLIEGICGVDYDLMLKVAEQARELWADAETCQLASENTQRTTATLCVHGLWIGFSRFRTCACISERHCGHAVYRRYVGQC